MAINIHFSYSVQKNIAFQTDFKMVQTQTYLLRCPTKRRAWSRMLATGPVSVFADDMLFNKTSLDMSMGVLRYGSDSYRRSLCFPSADQWCPSR